MRTEIIQSHPRFSGHARFFRKAGGGGDDQFAAGAYFDFRKRVRIGAAVRNENDTEGQRCAAAVCVPRFDGVLQCFFAFCFCHLPKPGCLAFPWLIPVVRGLPTLIRAAADGARQAVRVGYQCRRSLTFCRKGQASANGIDKAFGFQIIVLAVDDAGWWIPARC